MPQYENADRDRAERIFKAREYQKTDAAKATADYHAALQRVRDRTQELKRLRLQRETQKKRDLVSYRPPVREPVSGADS